MEGYGKAAAAPLLALRRIEKAYEGQPLLRGFSLEVAAGETVCLLGPSGSGKSTLLRIIAGLELPDGGQVLWEGQDLAAVPPHRRGFGLMFQDFALFPHRNVAENVAFGLRMQGVARAEIVTRVNDALDRVNLLSFSQRRVVDLSGGEQQRVALARALAPNPRLLMLDEPLGALDRSLREQLSQELRRILHETRIPAIYVTHDQEEAFTIADRLVLLHEGQMVQAGTPDEVYNRPVSTWAAQFFGLGNLTEGRVASLDPFRIETPLGMFRSSSGPTHHSMEQRVVVLLRPAANRLADEGKAASTASLTGENQLTGRVIDSVFRGEGFRVTLRCADDAELYFHLSRSAAVGEVIRLELRPESVLCLD
jgi:spermidine/putrescine transport system ATP-binding protein